MKIVLSVTIAIKDYFPKDQNIPYDNFICIFNNNNFNSKIKLSNISTQNSFKHKVECINSNIIYNLHMLDSTKNSLVGIYQLIINFDKIKNLNVNDILTQEETAKLIIDSKTKRKLFDKITNLGDIYLILSSEIKILGKKPHISDGRENKISSKRSSNIDSNNLFLDFNLSPRNIKKKQIIKILKNERDALKELDEYSIFNENNNNMTDFIMDENDISLLPNDTLRKYKSLNNKKMTSQNSIKYNELNSKNQYFENSSTQMISPKFSSTNYNFKKEDSKKTFLKKKQLSKKKVTILNLMEQKMDPALYSSCTTKDRNTLELSTLLNGFKNTNVNFNKIQVNHFKKNSFTSLNNHSSFKSRRKQKQTFSDKNNSNFIDESDFFKNRKSYKNNNKIMVNMNKNNIIQKTISEGKVNKNSLNIFDSERYNTEHPKIDFKKIKNINNIFLQTESINKFPDLKSDMKRQILTDNDLRKLIIEKDTSIRENFNNTNYAKNLKRGTFSPKISLKLRFTDNTFLSSDLYDKSSARFYKEKINKRILTPKTEHIKKVSFSNNEDNNIYAENEELRKKCFNLIEFYSLLTKKLKNICKNNIEYFKKLETMREKYHNLNKCKNKLTEMKNYNDSKKVKSHTHSHYEEEQLISSLIKIKIKENSIYQNIFGNFNDEINLKNKMNILILDKKEKLINLIRNIVKFYGNISQIYNKDKAKKTMLKNLLEKYEIKEKNKTDLNYINYIHKGNNFEDKIITEVDEDKENEEEDEGDLERNTTNNMDGNDLKIENIENIDNINNASTIINNIGDIEHSYINSHDMNNNNEKDKLKKLNIETTYDENLNNLIEKILIEEFPENYKTNLKFIHQGQNKYIFGNKIFHAFIKDNDVMLKELVNDNNISECNLSLNDFYKKYCLPGLKNNKSNYVYTKKIKQKYIKIKGIGDKDDQSLEKKFKNENSTTIETDIKQSSMISKTNEVNDIRNSIFDDKCE